MMHKFWIFIFFLSLVGSLQGEENPLSEDYQSYLAGENAKTFYQREIEFNKALSLYTEVTAENDKLYYNIGNTFYQLGEYPFAILYYYRSLRLNPHDENTLYNLNQAQQKLGINSQLTYSYIARPTLWETFFFLACLAILSFSLNLWLEAKYWKKFGYLLTFCSVLVLSYLSYLHYFEPVEGVLIHDSLVYRAAGNEFPIVTTLPLLSGLKVEIIEITQDGHWLKISSDGTIGYVPYIIIRII